MMSQIRYPEVYNLTRHLSIIERTLLDDISHGIFVVKFAVLLRRGIVVWQLDTPSLSVSPAARIFAVSICSRGSVPMTGTAIRRQLRISWQHLNAGFVTR